MTELEKAARMALEALQKAVPKDAKQASEQLDAITALTQALATTEPVQVFLVRDVAALLGASVPDVCRVLSHLGHGQRSTNMEITPDEALAVADHIRAAAATTERKGEPGLFATEVQPQPLRYSLDDYHRAPSEGPLNATWQDKPHRLLYDLVAALAYYTSPQATERKGPLSKDQIRGVFLAHGFTVKEGQTDLKPYVYDAAYALIALVQPATERKGEPPEGEFFAFEPEGGNAFYKTRQEAINHAKESLRYYRDGANDHGEWDEDVEHVRWGVVMQRAKATNVSATEDGESSCDYELQDVATRPAPGVPEGFALVPVEPTPEMKSAGIKVEVYSEVSDSIGVLTWGEVRAIYRAMLDAARKGSAR